MNVLKKIGVTFLIVMLCPAFAALAFPIGNLNIEFSEVDMTARVTGAADGVTLTGKVEIPSKAVRPSDGKTYTVTEIGDRGGNIRNDKTGEEAFYNCNKMTSIVIPSTVTYIFSESFIGCTALKEFVVASGNKNYMAVDGVLYTKSSKGKMDELVRFPPAKAGASFTIPDWISGESDSGSRYVCGGAFRDNSTLKTLVIGKDVRFAADAFEGNLGISKIVGEASGTVNVGGLLLSEDRTRLFYFPPAYTTGTFKVPSGIVEISNYGCVSARFTAIDFNQVTTVDRAAFKGSALKTVTVPAAVKLIGTAIFEDCTNLTEAVINCKIPVVESATFRNCPKLTKVTLPSSCKGVYGDAFKGCTSLTSFSLANMTTFNEEGYYDEMHFAYSGLEKVNWPSGAPCIEECMFFKCRNLKSISLKPTTETIKAYAFYQTAVETFNSSNLKAIDNYVFEACESLRKIVLPASDHQLTLGVEAFRVNENAEVYIDHKDIGYTGWTGSDWGYAFYGMKSDATIYTSRFSTKAFPEGFGAVYCPAGAYGNYTGFVSRDSYVKEMFGVVMARTGVTVRPNYPWVKVTSVTVDGKEATLSENNFYPATVSYKSDVVISYNVNGVNMSTTYKGSFVASVDGPEIDSDASVTVEVSDGAIVISGNSPVEWSIWHVNGTLLRSGTDSDVRVTDLGHGMYVVRAATQGTTPLIRKVTL